MNICKVNGGEYPTKGLVLMLVPASPEQKGNGSPTFTGKKSGDSEGKVFTRAAISRIQRTSCPLFHHSHTVQRARPAKSAQQDLTWALAAVLDITTQLSCSHTSAHMGP